jgi:hypothetical protein
MDRQDDGQHAGPALKSDFGASTSSIISIIIIIITTITTTIIIIIIIITTTTILILLLLIIIIIITIIIVIIILLLLLTTTHHAGELEAVLRHVNHLGAGAHDLHARAVQRHRQVVRDLTAHLCGAQERTPIPTLATSSFLSSRHEIDHHHHHDIIIIIIIITSKRCCQSSALCPHGAVALGQRFL